MVFKEPVEVGRSLNMWAQLPNELVSYGAAGDLTSAGDSLYRDLADFADWGTRTSLVVE
jgi:hypothetical protein